MDDQDKKTKDGEIVTPLASSAKELQPDNELTSSKTPAPSPPGSVQTKESSRVPIHVTRLTVWLSCSVILSLLPPVFEGVKASYLDPSEAIISGEVSALFVFLRAAGERGEIFLVMCALAGAIIGEMLGVKEKSLQRKAMAIGSIAILFFAASLYCFPIASKIVLRSPWFQIQMLGACIFLSGMGILLASMDRESEILAAIDNERKAAAIHSEIEKHE